MACLKPDGDGRLGARDGAVERVALQGLVAGFADLERALGAQVRAERA